MKEMVNKILDDEVFLGLAKSLENQVSFFGVDMIPLLLDLMKQEE
jgi:hypothetical protein